MFKRSMFFLFVLALLTACSSQINPAVQQPSATPIIQDLPPSATSTTVPTYPPTPTLAPSATNLPTQTAAPSATQNPGWIGPVNYPAGINPLTGLPAADPALLDLPPALISVSTFPYTARPQAGLSKAPFVYDVYYGDGMTRYLAVIYGDLSPVGSKPLSVGPIRSGRLPWEPLRSMVNGFLLICTGDETVLEELHNYTNVFSAINDVNAVMADATTIEKTAKQYRTFMGPPHVKGLAFSPNAPDGGKAGTLVWIPYAYLNQVMWRYDTAAGNYNRFQDNYDGTNFIKLTDRLDNQPVGAENVIVLFAYHQLLKPEKIAVSLANIPKMPALLFRDGKMYEIFWNSSYVNGNVLPMRFEDAQGNAVPLKPGHTWVEVVTTGSPYFETVESKDFGTRMSKLTPGSGIWTVKFLMP